MAALAALVVVRAGLVERCCTRATGLATGSLTTVRGTNSGAELLVTAGDGAITTLCTGALASAMGTAIVGAWLAPRIAKIDAPTARTTTVPAPNHHHPLPARSAFDATDLTTSTTGLTLDATIWVLANGRVSATVDDAPKATDAAPEPSADKETLSPNAVRQSKRWG